MLILTSLQYFSFQMLFLTWIYLYKKQVTNFIFFRFLQKLFKFSYIKINSVVYKSSYLLLYTLGTKNILKYKKTNKKRFKKIQKINFFKKLYVTNVQKYRNFFVIPHYSKKKFYVENLNKINYFDCGFFLKKTTHNIYLCSNSYNFKYKNILNIFFNFTVNYHYPQIQIMEYKNFCNNVYRIDKWFKFYKLLAYKYLLKSVLYHYINYKQTKFWIQKKFSLGIKNTTFFQIYRLKKKNTFQFWILKKKCNYLLPKYYLNLNFVKETLLVQAKENKKLVSTLNHSKNFFYNKIDFGVKNNQNKKNYLFIIFLKIFFHLIINYNVSNNVLQDSLQKLKFESIFVRDVFKIKTKKKYQIKRHNRWYYFKKLKNHLKFLQTLKKQFFFKKISLNINFLKYSRAYSDNLLHTVPIRKPLSYKTFFTQKQVYHSMFTNFYKKYKTKNSLKKVVLQKKLNFFNKFSNQAIENIHNFSLVKFVNLNKSPFFKMRKARIVDWNLNSKGTLNRNKYRPFHKNSLRTHFRIKQDYLVYYFILQNFNRSLCWHHINIIKLLNLVNVKTINSKIQFIKCVWNLKHLILKGWFKKQNKKYFDRIKRWSFLNFLTLKYPDLKKRQTIPKIIKKNLLPLKFLGKILLCDYGSHTAILNLSLKYTSKPLNNLSIPANYIYKLYTWKFRV